MTTSVHTAKRARKSGQEQSGRPLTREDKVFHFFNYLVFGIIALVCLYPFYYLFINTISRNDYVDLGLVMFLPTGIHFENYINIFQLNRIGNAVLISLARTVIGTVASVLFTTIIAYLFTKQHMAHRKLLYRFTIITMYFSAGMIPQYMNMKLLGLLNSFWVYIVPRLIQVYNMVLIKTFIESLPPSLEESAQIDGANYVQRFIHIVLPLSKPILATVALFAAVNQWNAFMDTLLYVSDSALYPMQFLLYEYLNQASAIASSISQISDMSQVDAAMQISSTAVRNTMTVVTILPIIFIYPFIQRYYVQGVMIGAVKG